MLSGLFSLIREFSNYYRRYLFQSYRLLRSISEWIIALALSAMFATFASESAMFATFASEFRATEVKKPEVIIHKLNKPNEELDMKYDI